MCPPLVAARSATLPRPARSATGARRTGPARRVLLQLGRLAGEMPLEQFLAEAVGLLESVVASPEAAIYRMDEQQRFMVLCSTRPESVA